MIPTTGKMNATKYLAYDPKVNSLIPYSTLHNLSGKKKDHFPAVGRVGSGNNKPSVGRGGNYKPCRSTKISALAIGGRGGRRPPSHDPAAT
jgi:hypothetical protein